MFTNRPPAITPTSSTSNPAADVPTADEMQIAGCPQCGRPAEVIEYARAASTHGPVSIVRVLCIDRHWLLMTRDRLPGPGSA